jgi:hypothetical protein
MKKLLYSVFAAAMLLTLGARESYCGGPLVIQANGQPLRWARAEVKGGPLNSTTVDSQGRVVYRVDTGSLGPLPNSEAVKLVDRIFKLYTDIPTSTIEFTNGGAILDPSSGKPVDITGENAGLVLSGKNPSYQNPIIFDSDGSITGRGGVLGFYTFINVSGNSIIGTQELLEGGVVLNGLAIRTIGKIPFLGVFTHEFGHFAGPLDHSQIYGWIASGDPQANTPDGFTPEQCFDIFAPFVETVYPFLFHAPVNSKLASKGFGISGAFITSLSLDDIIAMSTLYPTPGYLPTDPGSQYGGINGRIVIRTKDGDVPITGLNVIARRISRGSYPPRRDMEVFAGNAPRLDDDSVPMPPEDRDELDPLVTAASQVSGVMGGEGVFKFVGLPPGDYMVSVEPLNPDALLGSGIGPKDPQLSLTEPENYNGAGEGDDPVTDNPKDFTPVRVTAGSITEGIDIVLNGLGGSTKQAEEKEPNEKKKAAQPVETGFHITGTAGSADQSFIDLDLGATSSPREDGVEDLYRLDLDRQTPVVIILEGADPTVDLDLYIFSKNVKRSLNLSSPSIISRSNGNTAFEIISTPPLAPDTYYIGVSIIRGSSKYTLTVLKQR